MTPRDPDGRFARDGLLGALAYNRRKHERVVSALHGIAPMLPRMTDADLAQAQVERATAEAKLETAQAHAELAALRAQQS